MVQLRLNSRARELPAITTGTVFSLETIPPTRTRASRKSSPLPGVESDPRGRSDTPMMVGLKRISTAFGLVVAMASAASAQEVPASQNQTTANAVAGTLRSSRNLAGYRIEIEAREGLVTLRGALESPAQKAEAISRARYVAGVRGVVDQLRVTNDGAVSTVRYQPQGAPMNYGRPGGMINGPVNGGVNYGPGGMVNGPVNGGVNYGAGGMAYGAGAGPITNGGAYDGSPVPEGPAGMPGAAQASQPGHPNYAWPSYAPYPNFSAVGYPTAYPWQSLAEHRPLLPVSRSPARLGAPVTLRWDVTESWCGSTSRSTTPGRSSPRIRSVCLPIDRPERSENCLTACNRLKAPSFQPVFLFCLSAR